MTTRQMALSVRQPWAHLLVMGVKDVENRGKRTNWRGRLWIHAGLTLDREAYEYLETEGVALPSREELVRGALIGAVEIVGCVQDSTSCWAVLGEWHWQVGQAWALPAPIEMPSRLGLFPVDEVLARAVQLAEAPS